jgi:hypothetical protein
MRLFVIFLLAGILLSGFGMTGKAGAAVDCSTVTISPQVSSNHSSLTISSHPVSGSDRLLLVFAQGEGDQANPDVDTVTFNTTTDLTQFHVAGPTRGVYVQIWYALNPPAVTADVVLNYGGTTDNSGAAAVTCTGVDQSTGPMIALGAVASTLSTGSSTTANFSGITTTYTNSMLVGAVTGDGGDTFPHAPLDGQTERWDFQSGTSGFSDTAYAGGYLAAPTISLYDFDWSQSANDDWAVAVVEVVPVQCVATAPNDLDAPTVEYNQVILDWTSDCVNNDEYRVYRVPDFTVPGPKVVSCPTTGTYTDADVNPSTAYSYTVRGYNTAGTCESGDSNQVDVTTPAYEPQTTVGTQSATPGHEKIDVEATYSDDADLDLVISVYWDTVSGGETNLCGSATHPASPYQVSCTGLTNGDTYYIRVKYSDPDGFTNQAGTVYNWDSGAVVPFNAMMHNSSNLGNSGWPTGWGVSGGQYGMFVCETCHIDPEADTTTNIKRIRTQIETPNTDTWPNGAQLTNTIIFTQADGASSDMGDTSSTGGWTGICNVCHDDTKHTFYYWNGAGSHEAGVDCVICHKHQQAFSGDGPCMDCHDTIQGTRRQVVGAGGDFVRLSRHVSDGTSTEIVTDYDCIVCHAEGDAIKAEAASGYLDNTFHKDGDVDLRDVDDVNVGDTTYAWDRTASEATKNAGMRTLLDTFCLTCHDNDGASTIAVNGTVAGADLALTTSPTVGEARTPFNDDDNLRNGRDGFTTRTVVIDVESQFAPDTSGDIANTYNGNPSQHAVLGARYTTTNAGWTSSAWTAHDLRNGDVMNTVRETAILHCSDCHLSETNAHGAANAWHMLLDGTVDNYTNDSNMGGLRNDTNLNANICYKCHNRSIYMDTASTVPRVSHDEDGDWY